MQEDLDEAPSYAAQRLKQHFFSASIQIANEVELKEKKYFLLTRGRTQLKKDVDQTERDRRSEWVCHSPEEFKTDTYGLIFLVIFENLNGLKVLIEIKLKKFAKIK